MLKNIENNFIVVSWNCCNEVTLFFHHPLHIQHYWEINKHKFKDFAGCKIGCEIGIKFVYKWSQKVLKRLEFDLKKPRNPLKGCIPCPPIPSGEALMLVLCPVTSPLMKLWRSYYVHLHLFWWNFAVVFIQLHVWRRCVV